ncbi:metallophosphoesterase [Salinadaptatus halalkaliphilus]
MSDSHLGLQNYTTQDGEKVRIPSYKRFIKTIKVIQDLNPDLVIHTGDIFDENPLLKTKLYHRTKLKLKEIVDSNIAFCYIRGNHDPYQSDVILSDLLPQWDHVHLGDRDSYSVCDGKLLLYGIDYRDPSKSTFEDVYPPIKEQDQICLGLFHQSIAAVTRSFDASVSFEDLADKDYSKEYDVVALGHVHNRRWIKNENISIFVGGSSSGVDCFPSIGLLTLTSESSHYRCVKLPY